MELVFELRIMKLEIKRHYCEDTKREINALFVDGCLFDWGLELDDLKTAVGMCQNNESAKNTLRTDISSHFVESFSAFVSKELTLKEINAAIEKGEV